MCMDGIVNRIDEHGLAFQGIFRDMGFSILFDITVKDASGHPDKITWVYG